MPAERTDIGDKLNERFKGIRHNRGSWEGHWREVAQYVYPQADDFWQTAGRSSHGEKKNQRIYDATAMLANGQFASVLESTLVPRNSIWANLTVEDPIVMRDRASMEWLQLANETLFRKRYASLANFQMQIGETFMSIGAFGTGCIFTDDVLGTGPRYRSRFLGDIYFDVDAAGIVDTVFDRFDYSAKQAIERWGDNAPEQAFKAMDSDPLVRHEYIRVVLPNPQMDPDRKDAAGMPLMSVIVAIEDGVTCEIGGYRTMPYAIGRYQTSPHEIYGRGPAMSVLPDIRTLNEMARADLRATHKLVDPPLLVHDDGILGVGRQEILLDPGMINFGGVNMDGRPLIQPLQTGARVDLNEAKMEVKRSVIKQAFLVNLFEILENKPRMTATEVIARAQEKSALLGPIMGRIQSELLGPIIQRELEILFDMDALPPVPAMIADAMVMDNLQITYESPLSRMQLAESMGGIDMLIQQAVQLAQVGQTEVLDAINGPAIMDMIARATGAPVEVLRSAEEVAAIQQQRQQQEQQAVQQEQLAGQAGAMKDLAQAEQISQETGGI